MKAKRTKKNEATVAATISHKQLIIIREVPSFSYKLNVPRATTNGRAQAKTLKKKKVTEEEGGEGES